MKSFLHFMHPSAIITSKSIQWRPPSFPPPDDWPVSIDRSGDPLSLYGDDNWDFTVFGFRGFNFKNYQLSDRNLRLVKQVLILILYHPNLFPGSIKSCKIYFGLLVKIAKVCDGKGIHLDKLCGFPHIYTNVADALQCARYAEYISKLHKLRIYSDDLGFTIADKKMLVVLTSFQNKREIIQYPYIPPRIWSYQVNRLNECIDDFIENQDAIEKAFIWLTDAYQSNASPLIPKRYLSPFTERDRCKENGRIVFDGDFNSFLKKFELYDLFEKWRDNEKRLTVQNFTKYLNLIVQASIFYILNFSLQRLGEAKSLRIDCFEIEKDEKLGEIALIVGETTKTDPDSDARWIVSKTVSKAVAAAAFIANLRDKHRPKSLMNSNDTGQTLFLLTPAWEPWCPNHLSCTKTSREFMDYRGFIKAYPILFDHKVIAVTEEDWKIAMSLTPNLDQKKGFGVGLPWLFCAHQLRRTTNVNMFASDMVSDNSIQWTMKHLSRDMTLYYGRKYTNLRLNSEAETLLIVESYRAIYSQLATLVENSVEYVRPHTRNSIPINVINLIEDKEEKQIIGLIKQGIVGCRRTLLGYCMKSDACEYGGIESVAHCAGADGKGICIDAIFAKKDSAKLLKLEASHLQELETLDKHSPRANALKQEIYAIGVYFNVIN